MTTKRFLIVCRHPPYGTSLARDALDVAMATAAFDQEVAMLFLGDGVLQLCNAQDGAAIEQKSHDKQLSALPLYDVDALYVDAHSLRTHGLEADDLVLPAQPLTDEEIADLFARHTIVLGF
jgi:tRNA 2-thiouridine synthesizing protein C